MNELFSPTGLASQVLYVDKGSKRIVFLHEIKYFRVKQLLKLWVSRLTWLFQTACQALSLKSIPWTLPGFIAIGLCTHLLRIISTYVGNIKKSEVSWRRRFMFPQGETMLTYCPNSTIKYRVCANLIIILVVANNKTIHAPTSRDCYFY